MMTTSLLQLLLAPLAMLILFLIHVVIHRLLVKSSFILSFVLSFTTTGLLLVAVECFFAVSQPVSDGIAILAANLIIFVCLAHLYINVLTIGEASVRIKFLSFLQEGTPLSEQEILERYNARSIIHLRRERMLKDGQLVLKEGRLHLGKSRQIHLARFYLFWRRIVFGTERPV